MPINAVFDHHLRMFNRPGGIKASYRTATDALRDRNSPPCVLFRTALLTPEHPPYTPVAGAPRCHKGTVPWIVRGVLPDKRGWGASLLNCRAQRH